MQDAMHTKINTTDRIKTHVPLSIFCEFIDLIPLVYVASSFFNENLLPEQCFSV